MLDILVVLHEGGHFLVARLCGIKVNEFSIGMGPALYSHTIKKSGIKFSVRSLPFGGYVAMEGEGTESQDENAYCNKSVWKRMATVFAGPFVNVLTGFLAMLLLVIITVPATNIVGGYQGECKSREYGIEIGDEIIRVNNATVHTGNDLYYEVTNQGFEPVNLTVIRNGEKLVLENVEFESITEEGVTFGQFDLKLYRADKNIGTVMSQTFWRTVSTAKMIYDSLLDMLKGRYGLDSISGPIGMSEAVGEAASAGFSSLLYLFCIITVNLGVMNLLPLPALDGGHLLTLICEAITRKKINQKVAQYINAAGLLILLGFMALVTLKDIYNLF